MDLTEAKKCFKKILENLNDEDKKNEFFLYVKNEYINTDEYQSSKELKQLNKIADFLRKRFPYPSKFSCDEILLTQVNGINSNLNLDKTIEIDSFLYSDDDLNDLSDQGLISRHYCKDCGSKNVELHNFITHSVSRETLYEIFNYYLSEDLLKNKKILDVGSRIGAFLYGAYLFGPKDCKIYGIEISKELCLIQQEIIDKFKFDDRIEVINKDVLNCSDLVSTADIIFLHNVFEFFVSDDNQLKIWKFLKESVQKNSIFITIPSIEEMTKNLLEVNFINDWLTKLSSEIVGDENEQNVHLYEVI